MSRQPFFTRDYDFSEFMKRWRDGKKMTDVGEWVFDLRTSIDYDTPGYYPDDDALFDLVADHLRKKYHVTNAFIRTFRDEIMDDAQRAHNDAYWDQYESDLIDFLFNQFTDIANELADGFKWVWTVDRRKWDNVNKIIRYLGTEATDCKYEATGFRLIGTRAKFIERFATTYTTRWGDTFTVTQSECREDPDYMFDQYVDLPEIDPEDFDGRYGHFPDVKDSDILMYFDDYAEETPLLNRYTAKPHYAQVKAYIQNQVPLIHRAPLQELNYEIRT